MGFKKNNNFGKGRPAGSVNKNSKEIRELITQIVAENINETKERLTNLKDAEYFKAIGMLMKHVLPAQKQIEQTNDDIATNWKIEIIDKLTDVKPKEVAEAIEWKANNRNK